MLQHCLILLFIINIYAETTQQPSSAASSTESSKRGFWISTDLLSVEFRKGCLSTALCHQPKFKLINTMSINSDQSVISWPVNGGDFLQSHARTFVTYWTNGEPEDIAISCEITGTDPSFGFTRSCDETPQKRIYNDANNMKKILTRSHWYSSEQDYKTRTNKKRHLENSVETAEDSRMIVELRGKCFNATLAVRKHLTRCPWCPDPNLHIVVGQQSSGMNGDSDSTETFQRRILNYDSFFLHNCVILALSGAVVIAFSGLICVIFKHYNYKKSHQKRKNRALKFAPLPSERLTKNGISTNSQTSPTQLHKIAEPMKGHTWRYGTNTQQQLTTSDEARLMKDEQRYETPWENKFRPFQHWTMTTSSPLGQNESHYQQFMHYLQPANPQLSSNPENKVLNNCNTSCNSSSLGFNSSTGSGCTITIPPTINHNVPTANLPRIPSVPMPTDEMIIMGKTSHHRDIEVPKNIISSRHDDSGLESV